MSYQLSDTRTHTQTQTFTHSHKPISSSMNGNQLKGFQTNQLFRRVNEEKKNVQFSIGFTLCAAD